MLQMIMFTIPSKPFSYTGKGTTRRHAIIKEYDPEIDALYQASVTHKDIVAPSSWDASSTLRFVRAVVHKALGREVEDDVDLFQSGCDRSVNSRKLNAIPFSDCAVRSLQATWIYNQIKSALRETSRHVAAKLPQACVYQAPTVGGLAAVVSGLFEGHQDENADEAQTKRLQALIERYTSTFPSRPTALRKRTDSRDVILVTGTTGGLGSHILRHLLLDPSVARVFAYNKSFSTMEEQKDVFTFNGLDANVLNSPKLRFICGNMDEPLLGLTGSVYKEVRGYGGV